VCGRFNLIVFLYNYINFFVMPDAFEQVRQQIHEIRNFLAPLDIKLDNLDHQITASRIAFESKTSELDAKVASNSLRITEQAVKIGEHAAAIQLQSEQLRQIRLFLKMPETETTVMAHPPTPVREDKDNPAILPPQTPPK
jgi:hypothetical protein